MGNLMSEKVRSEAPGLSESQRAELARNLVANLDGTPNLMSKRRGTRRCCVDLPKSIPVPQT